MPRAKRLAAGLSVVAAATAIAVAGSTAAAAPRGKLTAAEYGQLTIAAAALNKSASSSAISWPKARAACARVGRTTALLRTQRANCFGTMNVLDALASFPAEQRRCSSNTSTTTTTTTPTTSTTTTGTTTGPTTVTSPVTTRTTDAATTTTPADSAAIKVIVCMNPRYQALGRDARTFDRAGIAARKQATIRGFTGACLKVLGPTPADLRIAKRFASSTAKLAADVRLLIKVTEGKLPPDDFNQTRVDNDVKLFENSATAVLAEHGQPKLSTCPHQ
jgi:hypothetical protein